jgi:hypothetical protein
MRMRDMSLSIAALSTIYLGKYRVRSSGSEFYFHVPRKLVDSGLHRVRVVIRVDASGCVDKSYHGSTVMFRASLTRIGGSSYRIKIPTRFRSMAWSIKDCGSLDVWIAPILEDRGKG